MSREPELQLWVALDDAPVDGGCLEVVPGSHQAGLATRLGGLVPMEQLERAGAASRALALPVRAGEAVLLHNHVWHRSARPRNGQRRLAFSVCFMHGATRCLRKKKVPRRFFVAFPDGH